MKINNIEIRRIILQENVDERDYINQIGVLGWLHVENYDLVEIELSKALKHIEKLEKILVMNKFEIVEIDRSSDDFFFLLIDRNLFADIQIPEM